MDESDFAPDPAWVPYLRTLALITALLLGLPALAGAAILWLDHWPLPALLLALAVLLATGLGLLWPPLRWRRTRYQLRPEALESRQGVLWRSVTTVPLSRVQHVDVLSGPLQRSFGLATLVVHTPGTRYAAVPLPGLAQDRAERLRDHLLQRVAAGATQSVEPPGPAHG